MKLSKLKLNQLSESDLNEREMVRILGGGTPGCCQCGCNYAGEPGGSSTSSNSSANDANGYTSDPGSNPCNCYDPYEMPQAPGYGGYSPCNPMPVDGPCLQVGSNCGQVLPPLQAFCG